MIRRVVRRPTSIPSSTLKDYLATGKADSRLIGPIDRHLMAKPADTSRRTDVLHPSEIVKSDWCYRASYHLLMGAPKPPEVKRLRSEGVFATGHEVHHKYQRWLYEMGALVGEFRCRNCHHVFWDQCPYTCPMCNSISLGYAEVPVMSVAHRIQGKADGWVTGLGADFLLEIKSIGPGTVRAEQPALLAEHDGDILKAWKDIKRPFLSHRRQCALYLELLHLERDDAPGEMLFLYELKATQEIKEFVVRRRPELVSGLLAAALRLVEDVRSGNIPGCNVNGEAGCRKCKPFEDLS